MYDVLRWDNTFIVDSVPYEAKAIAQTTFVDVLSRFKGMGNQGGSREAMPWEAGRLFNEQTVESERSVMKF